MFLDVFHRRSSRRNLDELLLMFESSETYFPFDVLFEKWLSNSDDWQDIPGYNASHSIRSGKKGGGVNILVEAKYHATCVYEISTDYNVIFESITVKKNVCDSFYNFLGVYRPPSGSLSSLNNQFFDLIQQYNRVAKGPLVAKEIRPFNF